MDRIEETMQAFAARRSFLRRSALIAGGSVAVAATLMPAGIARADVKPKANGQGDQFRSIRQHENDHVAFLVKALGSAARPKPTFAVDLERRSFAGFAFVSQQLEVTGVGAYLGATPYINSPEYLAAAGTIALIEGQHAGYLNTLNGDPVSNQAKPGDEDASFAVPLTPDEVAALAGPFIKSLNGGPALTYAAERSDANDIAILNFALALEYLEAEFYNVNVKKFYK